MTAWAPVWSDSIEIWSRKFIRRNLWRCDWLHSFEDLMQDAYMVFLYIGRSYPNVSPAQFMALYKRSMENKLNDRASKKQRQRGARVDTSKDVSELADGRIGETTNAGYLQALLDAAPAELKMALEVIAQNPDELWDGPDLNEQLRRILGFDRMRLHAHTKFDLSQALEALLS